MPSDPAFEAEITAWLQTAVATSDTLEARAPTIVPKVLESTGGARALAVLGELAAFPLGAKEQLRPGEVIGAGGMGVVRLAEQVALGRTVAVKTLRAERRDHAAALGLLREAWITGSVEHPNVVPVHYLGLDDEGHPLIVLKRIEGVDWQQLMKDPGRVSQRFSTHDHVAWNLGILIQVLNALRFAHSRGILHRDIKPSNVMIGAFGEVYLLDWGLAVSTVDDGSGRLPLARDATELAGTPCYLAPEMLDREYGALSERTDVYLAGAVLYEILAGRPPHLVQSVAALVESVTRSEPEVPGETAAELAQICRRAMNADPAKRYASVEAFQSALQTYLERRGSMRIAAVALAKLGELEVLLGVATKSTREEVYRLFGACRFGFHEALSAWPENGEARDGLERTILAVARYELGGNDPRVAIALLSELSSPPADLMAEARAIVERWTVRQRELERLGRMHDVTINARSRAMVIGIIGTGFTIATFMAAIVPAYGPVGHRTMAAWAAGFLAVTLVLGFLTRRALWSTYLNRRGYGTALVVFGSQIMLTLTAEHMNIHLVATEQLMMFSWMLIAAMMAMGIERRLAFAAVGYAICFGLGLQFPDERRYVMTLSNLIFTINALWVWWPRKPSL